MSISGIEARQALARSVSDQSLTADPADGRTIVVALAWFPRLLHGTPAQRANWRLIGGDAGIHWPDPDEDIGADGLLVGRRPGETQESLLKWLQARKAE
jgi:hypothetical protein